jgi:hypothetical protein
MSADCRSPTRAGKKQKKNGQSTVSDGRENNGSARRPNHQKIKEIYRASCGALELVGRDGSNGGASSAFVRDPVERILGRVLAIAPQTAPTKKWTAAKLETEAPTHSLYSTVNSG